MVDPRSKASGNISTARVDLEIIANLVPEGSRVLDIGCNSGDLLDLLVRRRGVDGRGLELSQEGVNNCVSKGLSVVQGNADTDLSYYPDNGFDFVILSQTLQATQKPADVLQEMSRIGKKLIVSIPNFGHWSIRLALLLGGQMPETKTLDAHWYDTANIHLCTLIDFVELCKDLELEIEHTITLSRERVNQKSGAPNKLDNLFAELGVFVIHRNES